MASGAGRGNLFASADARRLALLFGVVYFAQGMWNLPVQALTIVFKEQGLSAADVADFQLVGTLPWLLKPAYGLLSDFVPLFGRRRKSYFLLTSALAALAGFAIAAPHRLSYAHLAVLFGTMGFGLAFTDVLTDALMVEFGRPRGLTGPFQSVQWTAIYAASILVGIVGGYFAELRDYRTAFALAGGFPLVSFVMAWLFVAEPPAAAGSEGFRETWTAIRAAARAREIWLVAAFIFFFMFSPSFGPAFLYYQTDVLGFSQQFIGVLDAITSVGYMVGALLYAPLSRRLPLRTIMVWSIGASAVASLGYLVYRDTASALVISPLFGAVAMLTDLAFLDLAAKACPRHVEGTFFALLMAVHNGGMQLSMNVGGRLYDAVGYTPLVWITAVTTAAAWIFIPFVKVDRIEARARAERASAPA
ncbi:MAG TPA: MFS transporter [Methylomirabilota bacterium]